MSHASDSAIRRFAHGYRKAFEGVIAELNSAGGHLQFDRVRTDSIATATERVQAALARHKHGD